MIIRIINKDKQTIIQIDYHDKMIIRIIDKDKQTIIQIDYQSLV